jgi:dihydrofolate reductase
VWNQQSPKQKLPPAIRQFKWSAVSAIAQQLLDAGLVDELHVDIMPVFLGIGLRSFESSSLERVRLEKINVQEVGARTSLRFRVKQ